MSFVENPIINSPFEKPQWHYELDEGGQPTGKKLPARRGSVHVVPVPAARRRGPRQGELPIFEDEGGSRVNQNALINEIRTHVEQWRELPPRQWGVTPETQRLLLHWRDEHRERKLFFCQREALETLIYLTEVDPKRFRKQIQDANNEANPGLFRLASKMATGAGKTTVMGMIIAWHAVNRARRPNARHFSDAFLIVAPGITIRDRLRVLLTQARKTSMKSWTSSPSISWMPYARPASSSRIIMASCCARPSRFRSSIARFSAAGGEKRFTETVGEMIERVARELMGRKNIIVLNDEAHHCYRHKVEADTEEKESLSAEERDEAKRNAEAARVWISGIESFVEKIGVEAIYDLSATPFFLRGSGYDEGLLFPWVVSDFGLLDAIESGIVKVPRLPVLDDAIQGELPKFRDIYNVIRKDDPRAFPAKGRGKQAKLLMDPDRLPHLLLQALEALYENYQKTFQAWEKEPELARPPVFIVVCNNTATSKLVYDWISGYEKTEGEGETAAKRIVPGKLPLFSNVDPNGRWLSRFRTFLIDSEQLESGEALSDDFRKIAAREIEEFKSEKQKRGESIDNVTDADILREVMNTVGRAGRLGADIRCVVSVSMLTEGLGRQHGDAHHGGARFRNPASLRTGRRDAASGACRTRPIPRRAFSRWSMPTCSACRSPSPSKAKAPCPSRRPALSGCARWRNGASAKSGSRTSRAIAWCFRASR